MATWLLPAVTQEVSYGGSTATYWAMTEWMPAVTTKDVKAVVRMRQATSDGVKVTPAYQTAATRTDDPDDWAVIDSADYVDAENTQKCTGKVDLSTAMAAAFYVRFGVKVERNDTSTDTRQADVTLIVSGRD